MENYGVTVQKFKMAGNADEVKRKWCLHNDTNLISKKYLMNMKLFLYHRLRRFPSRSRVRNMSSRPRFLPEVVAKVTLTTGSRCKLIYIALEGKYFS